MKNFSVAFLLFGIVFAGCSREQAVEQPGARPVSYVTLQTMNPSESNRLTGTVESWKRENLGFEVAGRVTRVVEPGANIVGRTFDEVGNQITEGTILAQVDEERFQIALEQATAGADVARSELEQVIPEQLRVAQANQGLAQTELARNLAIRAEDPGAISQAAIDRADSAVKAATAEVAKVEALRATKAAELNTYLAQVDQAQRNLRNCKLRSPFTGQVARVNVIPGGYVLPGVPVVTVQMMDPMKVNVAVSAETDERINQNDLLRVFTSSGESLEGKVYLKDTFADPSTRTFLVTLLVRNRRVLMGVPEELKDKDLPECRDIWWLDQPNIGVGNYYAEVKAIQQDEEGFFVWKIENLTREQLYEDFDPLLTVKKVRVTAGEGRLQKLHVYTFRELTEIDELDPTTDVIAGDITGEVEDGGQMILVRERWLSRPGDVVRVELKGAVVPTGLYVPQEAIQYSGQKHFVAVAESAGDTHQVRHVEVTPAETIGRLQRIEAAQDAQLSEGMKVIVDGAHYVVPQDKVNPVTEIEVQP